MPKRPPIKLPWLNSMHHWYSAPPNRRPGLTANISGQSLLQFARDTATQPVTDPTIFLYLAEAIERRFQINLWLGWAGIRMWRKWEDFTCADVRFSGICLSWGRARYLREGDKVNLHERTWKWPSA